MTAIAITALLYGAGMTVLYAILKLDNEHLAKRLHLMGQTLAHEKQRNTDLLRRLAHRPSATPEWVDKAGEPLGYNEPSAFGPVEAARRGMTLGEHTADALGRVEGRVIPMQRRGQS
jgi:hypothetical protein